ncbi:SIMPL domain-containing protein [Sphingomonas piscis]|uniref:SIMPL domain-containing protein n=1 Tax=Sphingomonas piscis TaxID=2714943 RepID=A0A6G7YP22_9SPHN|nr:SIMPL domain-containing protein [Sphingomonas piscis]QIK78476.1 SIMPL domain-containing protein [Sphingomonas piscis]
MRSFLIAGFLLAGVATAMPAGAQQLVVQPMAGTRLDLSVTGEVTRVPDVAIISAGVVTRAATASAAINQNAARMDRVLAALKRAGIAERDVQTSSINLNPEYRYQDGQSPRLTGYSASNQVSVRFRDIANSGKILDALVAEGANQINGPTLTIDKPEAARDEARVAALAAGRARAELYARSLGKRVGRLISVSEGQAPGFQPMEIVVTGMRAQAASADSKIVPGEQQVQVVLSMSFELQ